VHWPIVMANEKEAASHSAVVAIGSATGVFRKRNIAAMAAPVSAHSTTACRAVIRSDANPKITNITLRNR
jgi:hypothetical protein